MFADRRQFKSFNAYDLGWNYDYIYSWQLGLEINGAWFGARPARYAAWDFAKFVAFYPSIFDGRMANVTTVDASTGRRALSPWKAGMHHFVAYVMGATGRNWGDQNLPPIQG